MRLITWNCGKGFRTARPHILELNPDIACLQELRRDDLNSLPPGYAGHYVPSHTDKGVAVIYKNDAWQLSAPVVAADIVAAFDVTGPINFRLIAIWPVVGTTETYIQQQQKAFAAHPEWLEGSVILAGDWNSHPRWDARRKLTHTSLVQMLSTHGIQSVYHAATGHPPGSPDEQATYLHQYREDQPFHIDYIFLSKDLLDQPHHFAIKALPEKPNRPSDHNPLVLDLEHSIPGT